MINFLNNWWRSYQFREALKLGNYQRAKRVLNTIELSGAKLSWLEALFKQQLESEKSLSFYRQEFLKLSKQIGDGSNLVAKDKQFIQFIWENFKLIECDPYKLQCTGILTSIFDELEQILVDFLQEEFNRLPPEKLQFELNTAAQDLEGLKQGIDPEYSGGLSPHVYFMKYFLENIYCTYLAWFLIYQAGLLPKNIKILDIAAGPATVIYGLALLLQSCQGFYPLPQMHISYYSLEQQSSLQFRGLQFWRKYLESQSQAINAFFSFNTANLFHYNSYSQRLPESFFNFAVVSHCFFYDKKRRDISQAIYREMFQKHLVRSGYILLIIQRDKLFNLYDTRPEEDIDLERGIVHALLQELGLTLEWYKCLTSTGKRTRFGPGYGDFARKNLPEQKLLSQLNKQYFRQSFIDNYGLDDYVILAKN